jgi:hypothetical protein
MKLPRASPGTTVVIAADVWNVLAAAVEKSNNFTVSAPLHLSESPSGRALSLTTEATVDISVLVTKIGGVSGTDRSANCTWTYDIFDAIKDPAKATKLNTASGGAALGLTDAGNGWRALKLQLTQASRGRAYRDGSGTWVLYWVDEKPANEKDCT